ncbi:pyridoxamine 5'-phosphate oxidase family protein [Ginsengibacter hankyongi]|uniref:Pyridoxamine 5'-phosphate oxidase family protein n=1 Tax=Ginsengibacter hankyongi TaxID=2607284 RepID=A0A5J5ILX5_9BACT|nr:pyridoxamine 5'-phosphate oxidase family protein [Ginsengibacter hankyongi]KAA9041117.1 pyridoxamine 5'-phosphate oxidase family protein [Ginsengibacter hankyongi]
MLGELNEMQINNFLVSQAVGRIACSDGKKPYIVPVTYVYNGKDIIGQTTEGKKLHIMRNNPNVCFEVDSMNNMANWRSVIINGVFNELKGVAATKARNYLFNHIWPYLTSSTIHSHEHEPPVSDIDDSNRIKPVMFRIKVKEKTGRFEKQ